MIQQIQSRKQKFNMAILIANRNVRYIFQSLQGIDAFDLSLLKAMQLSSRAAK